ncbi:hypothetical protein O3P69_009729 [Scylla paramamosain]|uniref:Uncharacterized protein n=1 Tax=Scylla paramamosain TaxID=85552 RepID=A0AAW0SD56_SCYPA
MWSTGSKNGFCRAVCPARFPEEVTEKRPWETSVNEEQQAHLTGAFQEPTVRTLSSSASTHTVCAIKAV